MEGYCVGKGEEGKEEGEGEEEWAGKSCRWWGDHDEDGWVSEGEVEEEAEVKWWC